MRHIERNEDMSPNGRLQLFQEEDGDPQRIAERNERHAESVKAYQRKAREQARLKGGLGR